MLKERAVIYCRVSTEEENQKNALENQVSESKNAITMNGWLLVGEYIDEGKSGTTTKKRDEYNRLVNDMHDDLFDIIVIKSQDRLMRNTKEWYLFVDKLVLNQKKLFFYLENKFYTTDDALITGIKAILAEEYSRELSKKINNAHKNRQKSGNNFIITSNTWGYDNINKEIRVNEEEAEIVRFIYEMCANGHGCRSISKMLQEKGVKSRNGGNFRESTIRRIIRNPLFKGTALLNVRHKDFNTKNTVYNSPEEWILREDAIPPIIDNELWNAANEKMDKRSEVVKAAEFGKRVIGKNLGRSSLSSKIICGECGNTFWRTRYKNRHGDYVINWACSEYVDRGRKNNNTNRGKSKLKTARIGGCDNIHIKDSDLNDVLKEVSNVIHSERGYDIAQEAFKTLEQILSNDTEMSDLEKLEHRIGDILSKRETLLEKMLEGVIPDDMFKMKDKKLKEEYDTLLGDKNKIIIKQSTRDTNTSRVKGIQDRIRNITENELALEDFVKEIDKLIIYNDKIILKFHILDDIIVNVKQINYRKKEFTVCAPK